VRNNLGTVLLASDPVRAASLFQEALAGVDAEGRVRPSILDGVACATLLNGDADGARRLFLANADEARPLGDGGRVHAALLGLSASASALGDHVTAARVAGAAAVYKPKATLPFYFEPLREVSRDALGGAWERHAAAGAALSVDEAIDLLRPFAPVTRTFLFTDIVSSTQLLQAIGDAAWQSLVDWHDRTLRALFADNGGEEVDHAGDGFFVAFPSPRQAVACAIATQRALVEHRRDAGFAPDIRIGIHEAEALHDGTAYRGLGVHTAARVGALAGPGEIVASETAAASAGASVEGAAEAADLKGLAEPLQVVRIAWR
jgi:class 3 adenylate cyclase